MRAARIAGLALALIVLSPASAGAVGWMTPPTDLSLIGQDANPGVIGEGPRVAVSPQRDITWVWLRSDGTNDIAQTRTLEADGTLTAVEGLSATGEDAKQPDVAIDANGDAHFTWIPNDGTFARPQTRRRDLSTGTLSTTEDLSAESNGANNLHVTVSDAGDATYAWATNTITNNVKSRTRAAGGTWTPALASAPDTLGEGLAPDVSLDVNGSGHAVIVWTSGGSNPPPSFQVQVRVRQANGTYQPALASSPDNLSSFSGS